MTIKIIFIAPKVCKFLGSIWKKILALNQGLIKCYYLVAGILPELLAELSKDLTVHPLEGKYSEVHSQSLFNLLEEERVEEYIGWLDSSLRERAE